MSSDTRGVGVPEGGVRERRRALVEDYGEAETYGRLVDPPCGRAHRLEVLVVRAELDAAQAQVVDAALHLLYDAGLLRVHRHEPYDPVRTERRHRRGGIVGLLRRQHAAEGLGGSRQSCYAEDEGPVDRPHVAQVVVTAVGQRHGAVWPHDAVHDLLLRGDGCSVGGQMGMYVYDHGMGAANYTNSFEYAANCQIVAAARSASVAAGFKPAVPVGP